MIGNARPPMPVSRRVEEIPEALSIYVNQLVYDLRRRGRDVTTLSLGEAYFDIPFFDFKKLDVERANHYSDSRGIPELRAKIADYYRERYGADVSGERELLITAGSKIAIFMAFAAVCDAGDEVVIHEPAWLSYQEQVRLIGAVPRFIPYDVPVEAFGDYLGPRARVLVLNNPNNPAGRLYTRAELSALYQTCRERGIYVLVDEAYSDFIAGGFDSLAALVPDRDGIIVINSLSKNLGISGWRVGYVIGAAPLIDRILKLNQHLITCAPTILLYYLARYFDQITAVTLPQARLIVEKRERVAAMLDRLKLGRLPGGATFYFFVPLGDYPGTGLDFALQLLLDDAIAVVPGSAYGESTSRFMRVSIGTESEERVWEALQIIRDRLRAGTVDPARVAGRLRELGLPAFTAAR